MKTIILVLAISYLVQVVINICIALYNQWYRGVTVGDVINELKLFSIWVWIPIIGLCAQIIGLIYITISNLWTRFKRLRIR